MSRIKKSREILRGVGHSYTLFFYIYTNPGGEMLSMNLRATI